MTNFSGKWLAGANRTLLVQGLAVLCLIWLMWLSGMVALWTLSEEYGHGLMVAGLLGYVLYRRREKLAIEKISYPWLALPLSILAMVAVVAGVASGIAVISMYGVLVFAVSVILAIGGTALLRKFLAPLLIIWLLIPLPNPFGPMLTSGLQLVSSQLGVWFIRLIGGVVYLEGNVIDMGGVQLLVAEACAGLRYLFPLMSMGAIIGYTLHAPMWIRWAVFLATVPITIVLNSFRIGLTGLMAELWGLAHTEGFLHFFEGWVVFIIATLMLLMTVWLLLRFFMPGKSIRDVLLLESPTGAKLSTDASAHRMPMARQSVKLMWSLVATLLVTALMATTLALRSESLPQRDTLTHFPLGLGDWSAREYRLPQETESVAGASEYYFGDFTSRSDGMVNLYVSFYETQLKGQIPHSPKVCIPGGGWRIENIQKVSLINRDGEPFEANRLVIVKGDHKQLTYYWLKQGHNMYSQEWLARLDLVRSSLFNNRTDGALIRMVTEIEPQQSEQVADDRLVKFSRLLLGVLSQYVPD